MGLVAAFLMFGLPAAVAFAQARGDDVQYNAVCQNIIGSIGDIKQNQQGSANANATNGESTSSQEASAVAEVAQAQGVSIEQVNECLNGAAAGGTTDKTTGGTTNETTGGTTSETTAGTTAAVNSKADVIASTIPDQKVLANTGGPALLLPALGLLVISSVGLRNLLRR